MTTIPPDVIAAARAAAHTATHGNLPRHQTDQIADEVLTATAPAIATELREQLAGERALHGETELRVTELHQLATDIIATYHKRDDDGYRGRAGQVQIAKWQTVLDGQDSEPPARKLPAAFTVKGIPVDHSRLGAGITSQSKLEFGTLATAARAHYEMVHPPGEQRA